MSVSILQRPTGFALGNQIVLGVQNLSGKADFYKSDVSNHGLTTGANIYIHSPVEDYNGFWVVDVVDSNEFRIERYSGAGTQNFIRNVDPTEGAYYAGAELAHKWSCVHLPIVYKLSNTLWPTNSADTVRDITNLTNSNGYCAVTAAGDIKATGSAQVLDFVKITGCTNTAYNGVWQIVAYTSDTQFTIDLPYSAGVDTDLTNNASVQFYYNNYVVKVQVWGGLNVGHEWYGQKPYQLLTTLNLIPDDSNIVKFSVADILKKQIEMENNLLLGTLPNNLDAFTLFFIKYGEEYDDSTTIYIGRTAVSYTSDQTNFEGRAVNAMLPFKGIHSGALSEYVFNNLVPANFMTSFEVPSLFSGKYFDLSFLWDGVTDVFFKIQKYLNGVLQTTSLEDGIDSYYTGVYRGEVSYSGTCTDYDRFDITAYKATGLPAPSAWIDIAPTWTTKTATQFTMTDLVFPPGPAQSYTPLNTVSGDRVKINFSYTLAGTLNGTISIFLNLTDSATNATSNIVQTQVPVGSGATEVTLVATGTGTRLQILAGISGGESSSGTVNPLTITMENVIYAALSSTAISETKQIEINCDCVPCNSDDGIYLSWLNPFGGFDSWLFTAYKDHITDLTSSGETSINSFPDWPNSYGEFADTSDRKQTYRTSRTQMLVRSQNLTLDQLNSIKKIKESPLVQIVNSIYDRRTVLVDTDSFTDYQEGQIQQGTNYTVSFTITYTNDNPSQKT